MKISIGVSDQTEIFSWEQMDLGTVYADCDGSVCMKFYDEDGDRWRLVSITSDDGAIIIKNVTDYMAENGPLTPLNGAVCFSNA